MEKTTAARPVRTKGIRLNRLNFLLIAIGVVIALGMIVSTYQTNSSFQRIVNVTDAYLESQQTTGMLNNIASSLSEQCSAFLHTGSPELTHAYAGQYGAIHRQIESSSRASVDGSTDEFLLKALDAFEAQTSTEIRAMRLMADTLPMGLEAFPPLISQAALREEDQALSPGEKKAAAMRLIESEEYRSLDRIISAAVDDSHRISSEKGKNLAMSTSQQIKHVIGQQKVLIFLFVFIAIIALLVNRSLIISPIQRSVDLLDRREPLPVEGSYEVRHLADVYNEVLKDNAQKNEALSYAANHDALTGLYNRAKFDLLYREAEESPMGILVADVDHFKQFNDQFGHETGDGVLKTVADKLKKHFREEDQVCRIGGDEFCVIMPGLCQKDSFTVTERIRRINRELQHEDEELPPVSLSAGFAFWDRPSPGESLFRDADKTLLALKKSRADCCSVYPS